MRVEPIDDAADPRVDDFRDLKARETPVVIAEGVNVVARLAASPYEMRAVFGVPDRIEALRPVLEPLDVAVHPADKWLLSDVVGFRVTRGVLASAARPAPIDASSLIAGARRLAVLEGLNDHENLGALFRNAAAFGVDAVLLDARCADPLYRRSVRVSMGHVLQVPFAVLADPWPEALSALAGFEVLAMTPQGSVALRSLPAPERWAVLLGAEGPGLSAAALACATRQVRIPMADGVDSLNVATAAAVAFAALT